MMLDLEQPNGRIELLELTKDVVIAKGQVLKIGGGIDLEENHKLVVCLSKNIDVFAWGPQDIEGDQPHDCSVQARDPSWNKTNQTKEKAICSRATTGYFHRNNKTAGSWFYSGSALP
ncbi:Uncharacterized protein Adt_01035 [Abeliophyllum distichum]|uniref:Uncharacterized protein n=1 Tax=Abeliophyllum distichum TaxID=126358 RepID=A0ABD1VRQ6_9LAMI